MQLDTEEVVGSNPIVPTIRFRVLKGAENRFIGERYVNSILWNSILSMIIVLWVVTRQQICRDGEV